MNDDWSLIGNEIYGFGYSQGTLKTLRRKLIKDVKKLFPFYTIDGKLLSTTGIQIKHIINKRFGVKDNAKSEE